MSYRGGAPMKRRGDFRGGSGGGHGYGRGRYFENKRGRFGGHGAPRGDEEENVREGLDLLISMLGQKYNDGLEKSIEQLVSVLLRDIDKFREEILRTLLECVIQIPSRIPIYSTVIGLINAKNSSLCVLYLERATQQLKAALRSGEFEIALTLVRSFSDLANARVVSVNSILQLFEALLSAVQTQGTEKHGSADVAASNSDVKPFTNDPDDSGASAHQVADGDDEERVEVPQARRDLFAYFVLSALPYVGRELHLRKSADLNRLLDLIQSYLSTRSTAHVRALSVFDTPVDETSASMPIAEDYLDCLWHQISNLRNNGWLDKALYRPYRTFDNVLSEAEQHDLAQIVPPAHRPGVRYPPARATFRLFECTDVPEDRVLPGTHTIERHIVEEHLRAVLAESHMNRRECAEAMLDVPATKSCAALPLDYLIIEVLFGELFRLPRAPLPEVAYASLLLELCKLRPDAMPLVLAQTTEMLFDALPTMHVVCIDRFVNWLSFHLSNFYYQWTFADWFEQLNESSANESLTVTLKAHLLRETLERCCRSSYYEKIKETLGDAPLSCADETLRASVLPYAPTAFGKFDSAGQLPAATDVPLELYNDSPHRGTIFETAAQMRTLFQRKATAEELTAVVRTLHRKLAGINTDSDAAMADDEDGSDSDNELNVICTDVFLSVLLVLSSKTMSHTNAFLERYRPVLALLLKSDRQKAQALRTVNEVYVAKQQLVGFVVQKLFSAELLDPAAIANWVFSDEMRNRITHQYAWEVLWFAVDRLNAKVRTLQTEFNELNRKYEAHQRRTRDGIESTELKCASDELNDEAVQRKEEALTEVCDEQKRVYFIVFQRLVMALNERLERGATILQDATCRILQQRMLQGFLLNYADLKPYLPTFESLIFTRDVDNEILQAFDAVKALCNVI